MADFEIDVREVRDNLVNMQERSHAAIMMIAKQGANEFENFAKQNRPWTDRTGRARQSLKGYTEEERNGVKVVIAHGVDYGYSLEMEHEQRYAICWPTVQAIGARVISSFRDLLRMISR